MNNNEEQTVWNASQSQASNFGTYAILFLLLLGGVTAAIFISSLDRFGDSLISIFVIAMLSFILFCFFCVYIVTKNIKYTLTSERLQTHTGVFSKQTNDLELYRVIDTRLEEPFLLRLFGLGNIVLITADSSSPALSIIAIKDASKLRNNIRNLVESRRDAKKVREFM